MVKQNKSFDLIVMGGGVGGIIAALRARRHGQSVALIEKENIGGASFNWGALPFQELLKVAKSYKTIKRSKDLGITGVESGKIDLDWKVIKHNALDRGKVFRDHIVQTMISRGVELFYGNSEALSAHEVRIGEIVLGCKDLLIATGGKYTLPDFIPSETSNFYTPKNFFSIEKLPKTMTIIGGGLIGIEYALLMSELGVKITIVEQDEKLMKYLDKDLRKSLDQDLFFHGVRVLTGWKAHDFSSGEIHLKKGKESKKIKNEAYLSAIKREANLDGVLRLNGLKRRNGFLLTDQNMKTTLPHVYAVGDVNGRALLAHVASKEGEVAADNIAGINEEVIYELLHYNMYATTQMASLGMTETIALENGFLVSVAKFWTNGLRDQYVKVVYDKVSTEVLGVHIYADNANDLICEAVYVMEKSESIDEFSKLIHSHPVHSMEIVDHLLRG
ncbi:MAG: FAD-dependent oxidoreductase [Bacteriovoracaceae bacterium]|nr:FAD-dependent oxidoreductase [Bacteriovoracaceae bacterium]